MKAYKFKVSSPEQSERLQNVLFDKFNAYWRIDSKVVERVNAQYIFMNASGYLSWNPAGGEFELYSEYKTEDTEKFITKHTTKAKSKWNIVADVGMPPKTDKSYIVYCEDCNSQFIAQVCSVSGKWEYFGAYTPLQWNVTAWRKVGKNPK